MSKNPILDLPLSDVMRWEIATPLQQMLHLYTVGQFLRAWRSPFCQKDIEQVFDSPEQAQHAAGICAAWLGLGAHAGTDPAAGHWWPRENAARIAA